MKNQSLINLNGWLLTIGYIMWLIGVMPIIYKTKTFPALGHIFFILWFCHLVMFLFVVEMDKEIIQRGLNDGIGEV